MILLKHNTASSAQGAPVPWSCLRLCWEQSPWGVPPSDQSFRLGLPLTASVLMVFRWHNRALRAAIQAKPFVWIANRELVAYVSSQMCSPHLMRCLTWHVHACTETLQNPKSVSTQSHSFILSQWPSWWAATNQQTTSSQWAYPHLPCHRITGSLTRLNGISQERRHGWLMNLPVIVCETKSVRKKSKISYSRMCSTFHLVFLTKSAFQV